MQGSIASCASTFRLYHIVASDVKVSGGFLKEMKTTSTYRYTEHNCSVSPKGNALLRSKERTQVYCPHCAKGIDIETTEDAFAKFPSELLAANKKLRKTLLTIMTRRFAKFDALICAVTLAFLALVFTIRTLLNTTFPFTREAVGFVLLALAIVLFFLIFATVHFMFVLIRMKRGVILSLGRTPERLLSNVVTMSPYNLYRVVTRIEIKTHRHQLSYKNRTFSGRSNFLSYRVDNGLFGGSDACYVESEYNNSVPTVG